MITAADLIDPLGDIQAGMFPAKTTSVDLETLVQAYLDRAVAIVATRGVADPDVADLAAAAYAYYLAFEAVYVRLSSIPVTLNFTDAGSKTRTQAQIDSFHERALAYLAEFETLAPIVAAVVALTKNVSTSVPTNFTW